MTRTLWVWTLLLMTAFAWAGTYSVDDDPATEQPASTQIFGSDPATTFSSTITNNGPNSIEVAVYYGNQQLHLRTITPGNSSEFYYQDTTTVNISIRGFPPGVQTSSGTYT